MQAIGHCDAVPASPIMSILHTSAASRRMNRVALRGRPHVSLTLLAAIGSLLVASRVDAACPNQCVVTVAPPVATPPLNCGTVKASPEDCDCGVSFAIVNGCPTPITAVDFEFDSCWQVAGPVAPCTVLQPNYQGNSIYRISTKGETSKTLTLRDADGDHQVELSATVTDFVEPGCVGCASASRGKPVGMQTLLIVAVLVFAGRRSLRR